MRRWSITLLLALPLLLAACERAPPQPTALEQVLARGELVVVTRNSATTWYRGRDGLETGFEYELARHFADTLGVGLRMEAASDVTDVLRQVVEGEVDFAAAGLTVTRERSRRVRFTPSYLQVSTQLVRRVGTPQPESLADLGSTPIAVIANSSHAELLRELRQGYPDLNWDEYRDRESEELLSLVWEGEVEYTVADSHELALYQRYYPELRVAFDLASDDHLAWAFPRSEDDSLYQRAVAFIHEMAASGALDHLYERHFGHIGEFDYAGTRTFMRGVEQRLPRFREYFIQAGERYGFDWRLLAAVGYQESFWNPEAVSFTGVRGLMMLTQVTADELGVDRLDPRQSIMGGARYLRQLYDRLPEEITGDDRLWMALASYNVGYGHVIDARRITEQRDGNPWLWRDVRESLPLLRQRRWYSQTTHGYARGHEPVIYVDNIRSYFDLLSWLEDREPRELAPLEPPVELHGPPWPMEEESTVRPMPPTL